MEGVLSAFTRAVESASLVAVPLALLWGIFSILLSPCHLASIPLIIGYITGQKDARSNKAFTISAVFSIGILITIAIIGVVTALAGRILGDIGKVGYYFASVMMLYFGLNLLDVLPSPIQNRKKLSSHGSGLAGALILGLVFGIALGPCTFAFMAPLLGIVFSTSHSNLLFVLLLIIAFAAGHCAVIVGAGTFSGVVQKYLKWNEKSGIVSILRKSCGILVIISGLYLLFKYS